MLDVERGEADAVKLLAEHGWEEDVPVDPFALADQMGIKVYLAQLGDEISGFIKKEPGQDPVMYIDADEALVRQRFTCAHELGHFMEHRDRDIMAYVDYRGQERNPRERYANAFAASLLMPATAVRQAWEKYGSIASCAKHFDVSQVSLKWRLRNLGITADAR